MAAVVRTDGRGDEKKTIQTNAAVAAVPPGRRKRAEKRMVRILQAFGQESEKKKGCYTHA